MGLLGVGAHTRPLLFEELRHGIAQTGMRQVVPGARQHRLETADQLVFALGAGVEARQAGADGEFQAW